MNSSTSIDNLKDDPKNNSQEIDNIINQIQQDNSQIKQDDVQMPQMPQMPQEYEEETQHEEQEYTMYDVIYNEVSYPLLVIVLFILLSIPQIDTLLCSYISFICNDSGDMNIFGVIFKSLIMGMLFYIFGKYVV
jgi:hypothetical protein